MPLAEYTALSVLISFLPRGKSMLIPGPTEYLKANLMAFVAGAVTVVVVHLYAKIMAVNKENGS